LVILDLTCVSGISNASHFSASVYIVRSSKHTWTSQRFEIDSFFDLAQEPIIVPTLVEAFSQTPVEMQALASTMSLLDKILRSLLHTIIL